MLYVTDTHSLIWYLTDDPKLSTAAKRAFQWADIFQVHICIPCIVFFELLYLVEKKRIPIDFGGFLRMISSSGNYRVEPLCLPIIQQARKIPRAKIKDPWDRIIAATSIHLNLPLITGDKKLKKIVPKVIW